MGEKIKLYHDMMGHKEQYTADEQDMIHKKFSVRPGKMSERIKGGPPRRETR